MANPRIELLAGNPSKFKETCMQAAVKVAALQKAKTELSSGLTPAGFVKLQSFSDQVIRNPDSQARMLTVYVATEGSFADVMAPTDAEVFTTLQNGWEVLAGIHGDD